MNEHPILFSAPMVRAILAGCKTQTRRVCKKAQDADESAYAVCRAAKSGWIAWFCQTKKNITPEALVNTEAFTKKAYEHGFKCPYGEVGDRLWVRETFCYAGVMRKDGHDRVAYRATEGSNADCWKPSIFMPRWASRITLEVTDVRVEHLQAITEADAIAEGCRADEDPFWKPSYADPDSGGNPSTRNSFEYLWHEINGAKSWMENPWVWVVTFRRVI